MTERPEWIDEQLGEEGHRKLRSDHLIDILRETERPLFSVDEAHAQVNPDVDPETVRNRLEDLCDKGILARLDYGEVLYYVDYPESDWPLSPEGKRELQRDSPLDDLTVGKVVRMEDRPAIRILRQSSYYLGWVFFVVGGTLWLAELPRTTGIGKFVVVTGILLILTYIVLGMMWTAAETIRGTEFPLPHQFQGDR